MPPKSILEPLAESILSFDVMIAPKIKSRQNTCLNAF
jgi:hypothetical protein